MTEGRKSVVEVIGEATSQGKKESWLLNSTFISYSVKLGNGGEKTGVFWLLFNFFFSFCRERRGVGKSHGRERRGLSKKEQRSEHWRRLGQEFQGSRGASPAPAGFSRPCVSFPALLGTGMGMSLSIRERTGARAAAPWCNVGRSSPELLGQASFLLLRGKTR